MHWAYVARETMAKLKGCSVKEEGRKGALNDVFRRPTVQIPAVCTIDYYTSAVIHLRRLVSV